MRRLPNRASKETPADVAVGSLIAAPRPRWCGSFAPNNRTPRRLTGASDNGHERDFPRPFGEIAPLRCLTCACADYQFAVNPRRTFSVPSRCPENAKSLKSRVSSAVEQRFCKPLVGSSILSPGTNKIRHFLHYRGHQSSQKLPLGTVWEDCNRGRKSSAGADGDGWGKRRLE